MKNSVPYISFVIPAKNEADYIGHCIQGIKNLSFPSAKIEIFVVDNYSTDITAEIAHSMGATVLKSSASSIAGLRNTGAKRAKGDIIGFVDADCIVHPEWLAKAVEHFIHDIHVCAVGVPEAPPKNKATWVEKTWTDLKHGKSPPTGISYTNWCASGALLIRRTCFEEIGGFNEKLATCEDADLSARLSKIGSIILDYRVPFQHLRGSRTLKELFVRERWRGCHNIAGFFSHGPNIQELPSVLTPLIFIFSLMGGLLGLVMTSLCRMPTAIPIHLSMLLISISIAMPALMFIKKKGPPASLGEAWRAYQVCFVYLLARGFGSISPGARTW